MAVAAGITFYEGGVGLVEDGVIEGGLATRLDLDGYGV